MIDYHLSVITMTIMKNEIESSMSEMRPVNLARK